MFPRLEVSGGCALWFKCLDVSGGGVGGGYFIVPMSEYFRALRVRVPIVHASMSPRGVFHSSNA